MKNYQELVKTIQKEVKRRLKGEATGHDYWHCQRVVRVALQIGKEEHADLTVLELAGWLHDISVKKGRKNHEVRSAVQGEKLLTKLHVEKELIEKVVRCIRNHRFSTGKVETLEDMILQDADKLDVMGAIGIARGFAFAGRYKRIFHDGKISSNPQAYKKTGYSRTIIQHFYDKIFLLPDMLHTKTAKRIGVERIQFTKEFVKRFLEEWG
ncbi:HD domain-containing protein [Patescibacteria group bacterium]|nr:HD domain-containing protein [Patescibacteria group bacterium]